MRDYRNRNLTGGLQRRNAHVAAVRASSNRSSLGKRSRGTQNERLPFSPPEDWYEPSEDSNSDPYSFKVIVQPAGTGYRHILTPDEIRKRLSLLPPEFVAPLEVVQLSRMTRKKERFACYGMQWGTTLYLYPLEEDRIERHSRPPKPAHIQEARMYGGHWTHAGPQEWRLIWTEAAVRNFYLNNILIHELGHLLDERNSNYCDRERFAEWFALEYGYKPSRKRRRKEGKSRVIRRHHRK